MIQYVEEYKLVTEEEARVEVVVNEMLKGGWVPLGSPSVTIDDDGFVTVYQAMVKIRKIEPPTPKGRYD